MTPKEKANELVLKFQESLFGYDVFDDDWVKCINCALIAVDEILEFEKRIVEQIKNHVEIFKEMKFKTQDFFWESVKQEIEKL